MENVKIHFITSLSYHIKYNKQLILNNWGKENFLFSWCQIINKCFLGPLAIQKMSFRKMKYGFLYIKVAISDAMYNCIIILVDAKFKPIFGAGEFWIYVWDEWNKKKMKRKRIKIKLQHNAAYLN